MILWEPEHNECNDISLLDTLLFLFQIASQIIGTVRV